MFSWVSVILSRVGWVCLVPGSFQGVGMPGPRFLPGWVGMPGTPPRKVHPYGRNTSPESTLPLEDAPPEGTPTSMLTSSGGHRSGRYASYWNAVLIG